MKDNNDSKKNFFNESQKENEDPMKSETLLLKSSRVSNLEKEKYNEQIKELEKEKIKENQTTNQNLQFQKTYEESPSRYYILVAYCFCIFSSGFQWLSFTSLPYFSYYYELSQWKVDFFSLIYIIEYLVLFVPEIILSEKISVKNMFRICSLCIIIGSFLKIFINKDKSLSVSYLGQIISGLGRPYLLMIHGKISADWFKENKRNFICTICFLSDIAGILIGYIWNLAYIKKEENNKDDYKDHVYRYFLSGFVFILVFTIPALFIDENQPEKPSSPSKKNKMKEFGKESLKIIFSNFKYIFILIAMFFIGGYYFVMSMKFIQLLGIYSLDKDKSDLTYSISITAGVISSLIMSYILDKYKKYKIFLIILISISTISQLFLTFLLELVESKKLNSYAICIIFYIFINGSILPYFSFIINYTCEITYPVAEYISISFIIAVTQIYNICGHFLYKYLLEKNDKKYLCNLLFLIFLFVCIIFTIFYESKLERYEIDKNEENQKDSKDNNKSDAVLIGVQQKK